MAPTASSDSSSTGGETRRAERLAGLAIYGAASAGVGGLGVALLALLTGRWDEAAGGLVAAAVAFGALANALLRR